MKTVEKILEASTEQDKLAASNFVSTLLRGKTQVVPIHEDQLIVWDGRNEEFDNDDAKILEGLIAAGAFDTNATVMVETLLTDLRRGTISISNIFW